MSRWHPLVRTSTSGKRTFVCLICGRVSYFPDKNCPPFAQWTPTGPVVIKCEEQEPTPPPFRGSSPISAL